MNKDKKGSMPNDKMGADKSARHMGTKDTAHKTEKTSRDNQHSSSSHKPGSR